MPTTIPLSLVHKGGVALNCEVIQSNLHAPTCIHNMKRWRHLSDAMHVHSVPITTVEQAA